MTISISFSSTASRVNQLPTHVSSSFSEGISNTILSLMPTLVSLNQPSKSKPLQYHAVHLTRSSPASAIISLLPFLRVLLHTGACANAALHTYLLAKSSLQVRVSLQREITPAYRWSVYLYKILAMNRSRSVKWIRFMIVQYLIQFVFLYFS